jgi:hypothetical protein
VMLMSGYSPALAVMLRTAAHRIVSSFFIVVLV